MIAAMNGNRGVVSLLVSSGANMRIEDIEGKTARDYAIDALEIEMAKGSSDIKIKQRIAELTKIKALLPDEDREGEVDDEETPNAP